LLKINISIHIVDIGIMYTMLRYCLNLYCMSKKSRSIFIVTSLYTDGQGFLGILYTLDLCIIYPMFLKKGVSVCQKTTKTNSLLNNLFLIRYEIN